jgi:hypothetical protein
MKETSVLEKEGAKIDTDSRVNLQVKADV